MMERVFVDADLEYNLNTVREHVAEACIKSGRAENAVTLMAVTKTVPAERINAALALGITHIGENRVQEFLGKQETLRLDGVQAHLIGHLQTNKVRHIVGQVDMIQSVDSVRLAEAISRVSLERGLITPILVEVNIGGEEAKSGISPDRLEELLENIHSFKGIHVRGLMTVPPILTKEYEKRAIFSKMYQMFVDKRAKKLDNIDMLELSMGMSGDYTEAIMEGATLVRVGSAIFGARQY